MPTLLTQGSDLVDVQWTFVDGRESRPRRPAGWRVHRLSRSPVSRRPSKPKRWWSELPPKAPKWWSCAACRGAWAGGSRWVQSALRDGSREISLTPSRLDTAKIFDW